MKSFRDSRETATMRGDVNKTSPLIEAVGTIDELDAFVGFAHSTCKDDAVREELKRIQRTIRSLLGELAGAPIAITAGNVRKLESLIEKTEESLPPLRNFILTWKSPEASSLNVCRVIARRAERRLLEMEKSEPINKEAFRYFNRLSDVFFALARLCERKAGFDEETWNGKD